MAIPRNSRFRSVYEPEDDFGSDEAFLQNVAAPKPAPSPWEPLAGQISQQWQQYGINPDIKGINRANELAQILTNYGITDISKLGIKETPYEEMRAVSGGGPESGDYVEELYKGKRGQLTYDDKTFGRLGGFGSKGQQEFSAPQEFLTEAGNGRYGLGYSAAGKGWTDYEVVARPDGTPVIVPKWGSSSDAGDIAPLLAIASFIPGVAPFAAAANAALSLSQGNVLGGIASLAGLGGFTDVANAARLASAVKNEDILGAVMPGLNLAGVSDVGGFSTKDIGTAVNVARAIEKENPLALLGAASAYLPGPAMPGVIKDADIEEDFFAYGKPGFMPTEALSQEEVQRELDSLLARYPAPVAPSDWFPDENVPSGIPEWDFAAASAGLPIGNLEQDFSVAQTKTGPQIVDSAGNVGTFVNGEFVVDTGVTPDLSYAATSPPAPGKAPAPAPAPAAPKGSSFNPAALFGLAALMGQQQQKPQEQYQTARTVASPFGMDLIL